MRAVSGRAAVSGRGPGRRATTKVAVRISVRGPLVRKISRQLPSKNRGGRRPVWANLRRLISRRTSALTTFPILLVPVWSSLATPIQILLARYREVAIGGRGSRAAPRALTEKLAVGTSRVLSVTVPEMPCI